MSGAGENKLLSGDVPHCFLRDEGHQTLSRGHLHLAMVSTGKAESAHYHLCGEAFPSGSSGPRIGNIAWVDLFSVDKDELCQAKGLRAEEQWNGMQGT